MDGVLQGTLDRRVAKVHGQVCDLRRCGIHAQACAEPDPDLGWRREWAGAAPHRQIRPWLVLGRHQSAIPDEYREPFQERPGSHAWVCGKIRSQPKRDCHRFTSADRSEDTTLFRSVGTNPQFPMNTVSRFKSGLARMHGFAEKSGRNPNEIAIALRVLTDRKTRRSSDLSAPIRNSR